MVNLRLTKMEVQELRLAMQIHRENQEKTGVTWEEDQQRIREKLDEAVKKEAKKNGY